jgi:membrane-associated phospholipid phosphatase
MRRLAPSELAAAGSLILLGGTPVLLAGSRIRIEPSFLFEVSAVVVFLQILSLRYRKQAEGALVAVINGSCMIMLVTTVYAIAQYCLPEHAERFYDEAFASFDAATGLTADDIVSWSRSHPRVDFALSRIYYAFFFHFALYIPYAAGVRRDPYRMYQCLAQIFVAAIIGLALFGLWPAKNAVFFYGHEDIHHTSLLVAHLQQLQDGTFGVLTHQNAQGLIQFPSFHMAIAAILWWDLRHERNVVFGLGGIWTLLMGVAAVTTGGHYVIDIWGGLLIALSGVVSIRILSRSRLEGELDCEPIWRRKWKDSDAK